MTSSSAWLRQLAVVLYGFLVILLSLLPSGNLPGSDYWFPGADKIAHFLMYGAYAILLDWSFAGREEGTGAWLPVVIVLFCALFGTAMEIMQGTLSASDRTPSFMDDVMNVFGSAVSIAVRRRILRAIQSFKNGTRA